MDLPEGETVTYERTFTHGDVERFVEVSNDRGEHHVEPDEQGRLLVHGLLTATLPTKVGGDHDVLASRMEFDFRRPVWTDETVRCVVEFVTVEPGDRHTSVEAEFDCTRLDDGETVLSGRFEGIVRD